MPQAERILEKVALNEVSPLPWRWKYRDERSWQSEFQISDDDGMKHVVGVEFSKAILWFQPQTELTRFAVDHFSFELQIPNKLLTDKPSGQTGPKGLSVYNVDFYTDMVFYKDDLGLDVSFAKIAPRVFATVAAMARAFLKERKPDVLTWKANSREKVSIYKRMVKREKLPGYVGWHGNHRGGYLRLSSPLAR